MALLYPWATKEYLLWEMTIGQIVMYHNLGIEMKYPKPDSAGKPSPLPSLKDQGYKEARRRRDELRKLRGGNGEPAEVTAKETADNEVAKAEYRRKYGDV